MGFWDWLASALAPFNEQAQKAEQKLASVGLGQNDVGEMSGRELVDALSKIDEIISDPNAKGFETELISETVEGRTVLKSIDTRPYLLARKSQIVAALKSELDSDLSEAQSEVAELQSAGDTSTEATEQSENRVEELKLQRAELEHQAQLVEAQRRSAELEFELEMTRVKIDRHNAGTQRIRTLVGRDTIAAVVGGILLLIFAPVFVVAMFVGTAVTEIISSAFLVVLGYFFGQATARSAGNE